MIALPLDDPYPHYHALRRQGAVLREAPGMWTIIGYAEASAALKDPRLSSDKFTWSNDPDPIAAVLARQMVFADPPAHTRLRGLVARAFTPRIVEAMRVNIRRITDELLDRLAAAGGGDIISTLAYPLPLTVIAEMLGVPTEDRQRFKRWSDDFFEALQLWPSGERAREILQSLDEFSAYFRARLAPLRASPRDDLLSALVIAQDREDRLSEEELLANALLLLAAGHETTTNLIGNGLFVLLRNPDQCRRLLADPSLIGTAVEELLRYDSPVQWTGRIAREPLEIGGQAIPAGAFVSVSLAGANRDPAQFPEPDRLDIGREPNRHLAFGHGPHFCLGAALARLEGRIALGSLLARFPRIGLATDRPERLPLTTFRALKALPVTLER